jgi:hypothetical protein
MLVSFSLYSKKTSKFIKKAHNSTFTFFPFPQIHNFPSPRDDPRETSHCEQSIFLAIELSSLTPRVDGEENHFQDSI